MEKWGEVGCKRTVLTPPVLTKIDAVLKHKPATNAIAIQQIFDSTNVVLPKRTLRDAKRELGYVAKARPRKPYLSDTHAAKRLEHATTNLSKTQRDWSLVAFSDEVQGVHRPAKYQIVKKGEQADKAFTFKEPVQVMFWGCISGKGKSPLWHTPFVPTVTRKTDLRLKKNAHKRKAAKKAREKCWNILDENKYIENILKKHVVPYMRKKKCKWYVHDNAPAHGRGSPASKSAKYLAKMKIPTMKWPPNSPDLNPIELVWRWIKSKIAGEMLRTKEDIVKRYTFWWKKFPLELYKRYTDKLPELMKELKKSKGYAQFS